MRSGIKLLLIAAYVASQFGVYSERLLGLDSAVKLVIYLGLCGLVVLGVLCAAQIGIGLVRYAFALGFLAGSTVFLSFQQITAEFLTYNSYISISKAAGFIGEALAEHYRPILQAVGLSLLLALGIAIRPSRLPGFSAWVTYPVPVLVLALLSGLLFIRGGDGAKGLPPAYTVLAYASLSLYEHSTQVIGERRPVSMARENRPIDFDIILVVDESISPLYLDITGPGDVDTGLRDAPPPTRVHNYGYAAAISHCSLESNLTIRYGGTRTDYLAYIHTMPSIWEYARMAGMKTTYIDAQRTGGTLQNQMTAEELALIDNFVQFDDTPLLERDLLAADEIVRLARNDEPDFVLVNKLGAHFPVHDKFPDSHIRYRPILPRGRFTNIADTGSREGFSGKAKDWRAYRNSYRNTLLWSVGEFFKRLFAAELDNYVMIYTADHGQDLHENHSEGLNTHCSSYPHFIEGMVPMVVIEDAALQTLDWGRYRRANRNRTSHYQMFPTLLELMAYDSAEIARVYGQSLHLESTDPMTFNTNFHARLGEKAEWMKIDFGRMVTPPPGDSQ